MLLNLSVRCGEYNIQKCLNVFLNRDLNYKSFNVSIGRNVKFLLKKILWRILCRKKLTVRKKTHKLKWDYLVITFEWWSIYWLKQSIFCESKVFISQIGVLNLFLLYSISLLYSLAHFNDNKTLNTVLPMNRSILLLQ